MILLWIIYYVDAAVFTVSGYNRHHIFDEPHTIVSLASGFSLAAVIALWERVIKKLPIVTIAVAAFVASTVPALTPEDDPLNSNYHDELVVAWNHTDGGGFVVNKEAEIFTMDRQAESCTRHTD
jgi:hypothetical protein